jgi:hypothetical protein
MSTGITKQEAESRLARATAMLAEETAKGDKIRVALNAANKANTAHRKAESELKSAVIDAQTLLLAAK